MTHLICLFGEEFLKKFRKRPKKVQLSVHLEKRGRKIKISGRFLVARI